MRVCDVVLNSVWYDPRVRKQIAEYKKNGIDVVCVGMECNRYNEEKIRQIPCDTTIVKIDKRYDGKQTSVLKKIKREQLRQNAVVEAIIKYKPDVIHANDLNALIPAYKASRKLQCKIIYDSHEINIENYTSNGRSRLAVILRIIEKYLVKHIDLMVCVSNAAADYFGKKYGIMKPMVVTNCSLKREAVVGDEIKHNDFEILNHGQFYEGRGYDIMVNAASLLHTYPEIRICVRGFGKLESDIRKKVMEDHLKNFVFYPPVNVEELIQEASRSHVGVAITQPICLNFKLSVSNKLFEYAAAGLPIIMSDIPEHRYLNEKYSIGIILENDTPECFAEAVLKLYKDPKFYAMCSENSIRMSRELNWEDEFMKLINAVKILVDGRKGYLNAN